jgi:hypothetical protein
MAGTLDRRGQGPLVPRTIACLAAGPDFTFICDEALEQIDFFVINAQGFVSAKLTGFRAGKVTTLTGSAL